LNPKLDELKWTLGLILSTAVFFTLAQFAAAWFSAEAFTKKAEDALKRIQDIEKDVQSNYPIFSRTEKIRAKAYRDLAHRLREASKSGEEEGLDWRENFYERMEVEERQELLSVERFIGIEFREGSEDEQNYARELRRLANFYVSKFQFERKNGFAYYGDLERAEYCLHLALNRVPDCFYLLNDLGLLQLHYYDSSTASKPKKEIYLAEAKRFLEKSLRTNPRQQRANFDLAVQANRSGDLGTAVKYLRQALDENAWERVPIPEMRGNVCYQLGCYSALLAVQFPAPKDQAELLATCVTALRECASIGRVSKEVVDSDFDEDKGDLHILTTSPDPNLSSTAAELTKIRPNLSANSKSEQHSRRRTYSICDRFKDAWQAFTR
jgi:tetratricopeptide (TPR) repeat protein